MYLLPGKWWLFPWMELCICCIVGHEYFHEWNDLESGGALHPRSLQSVPSILVSDPKIWTSQELCSFFCSSPEIDLALFSSMNVSQHKKSTATCLLGPLMICTTLQVILRIQRGPGAYLGLRGGPSGGQQVLRGNPWSHEVCSMHFLLFISHMPVWM